MLDVVNEALLQIQLKMKHTTECVEEISNVVSAEPWNGHEGEKYVGV